MKNAEREKKQTVYQLDIGFINTAGYNMDI